MKRFLLIAVFALATTLNGQEEHAEHKEEDPMLQTWKWANFGLLAVGMIYMLGKALPKNFAERTAALQKEIREAQAIRQDAEKRAAAVEAKVAQLGADIETFRKESAADMAHEGERIRQETEAQIKRTEQQSALEIESAGKIARRELKQFSAELALKMAEERVRSKMDAHAENGLVDGFVAELARQGSKN